MQVGTDRAVRQIELLADLPVRQPFGGHLDDLQFLHPIKVGDLIILQSHVTCTFTTSLEVQVDVYSEETLTGRRLLTSRAFLTFVAIARDGSRIPVTPLLVETEE